ncbi:hypothetical protein QT609_22790, partial [Xanthomonas citri pv. citri]
VETIGGLTSSANVVKSDVVAWAKASVSQMLADVTAVRNTTLVGQQSIGVKSLKQTYFIDVADTTTADDGLSCIISADGYRFKPVKLLPAGDIVGTSDTQTLTNKTIDGGSNTFSNIAITSLIAIGAATLLGNPT